MSWTNSSPQLFDSAYLSVLSTLETAELTPLIQLDFVYGINTQTGFTAASGAGAAVSTSLGALTVLSGTASNGYAVFSSVQSAKYRAGQGIVTRFTTTFGTPTIGNTQLVGAGSVVSGAPYDGCFFGYNGVTFGIFLYAGGVQTFVPQSSWNGDTCIARNPVNFSKFSLTQQNGNEYMIKYPFLGYGNINFYVQNALTSRFILVHVIQSANAISVPLNTNPSLAFIAESFNSASITTGVTIYTGCVGFFVSGIDSHKSSPKWAIDNNKSGISTETCIVNLKNCTSYNGVANRSLMRLTAISLASASGSASSAISVFRLKWNAIIGGTPSFACISGTTSDHGATITSGNSIASYDTAGTTVSGGQYRFNVSNTIGQQIIDLTPFELFVIPGDILSVTAYGTTSSAIGVSLNWTDDT